VFTTPVVDAAPGTELSTWLVVVVTDDPTALTVLPTMDVTGEAALLLPAGRGDRVVPPPPPGELPDATGEAGVPVKVAAPMRLT